MKNALLGGIVVLCVVACGGASDKPAAQPEHTDIARLHKARCGTCHVRVEPGERTRAELETALSRHRNRVRLTEDQWGLLVDYLAAPVK